LKILNNYAAKALKPIHALTALDLVAGPLWHRLVACVAWRTRSIVWRRYGDYLA
jgi:hypothetical protein